MIRYFFVFIISFIASIASAQMPSADIALLNAASKGDEKGVLQALHDSAYVDATNDDGVTALMYASQKGYLNIVKILIYNHADVNAFPNNGITSLISAAIYNKPDILECLVLAGADINKKDANGISALLYATAYGNYQIVDMLFFYGADIYASAPDGVNSLFVASFYGYSDIVELLINRGADATDFYGWTPLMVAVQNKNYGMIDLLINKKADINKYSYNGVTPIAIAVLTDNSPMVDTLLKKGANVKMLYKDTVNWTDMGYRVKSRHIAHCLKKKGIYIDDLNWDISLMSFSANKTDLEFGNEFAVNDNWFGFFGGYQFRLFANRVITTYKDEYLMQKWERRAFLYLGANSTINLKTTPNRNFSLSPYIKGLYSFGSYRGSNETPDKLFRLVPGLTFNYCYKSFFTKIGYEYIDLQISEFNPNRMTLSVGFKIRQRIHKHQKKIDWI